MLRLRKRRFSFCRFRLICDLILAKVFLQTIVPVFFGKILVADPASAGPFFNDGDVFYMRRCVLSSNWCPGVKVSRLWPFNTCPTGVLRKDVESTYGFAEITTQSIPSARLSLTYFSEEPGSHKSHRPTHSGYPPGYPSHHPLKCIRTHPPPGNVSHTLGSCDRTRSNREDAEIFYGFVEPGLCHSWQVRKHLPEPNPP